MEETYGCGKKIRQHENDKSIVKINMSEIYSIPSLESKRLMDYLKSFSQTSIKIKDSLECLYHLKQKSEKKLKCIRHTKPYSRIRQSEKHSESMSSMHKPKNSENIFSYLNQKHETKDASNTKYLKVINPNGTTTEVTLQPVVLMHVREIPPGETLNNKDEYQLRSAMNLQSSSCQVSPKISHDTTKPAQRVECGEGENHENVNVLKVKSSRNCTDLTSERNCSNSKTSNCMIATSHDFRTPSTHYNARKFIKSKMSLTNCVCYHWHNLTPDCKVCCGACLGNLYEKGDNVRLPSSEKLNQGHPQVNCSVTTVFRRPTPKTSNTSSVCIQNQNFIPKQSNTEIKKT